MNAQNITHDKITPGLTVRDIRSARRTVAHGPTVKAEGAALTFTSAGWNTVPAPEVRLDSGDGSGRKRDLRDRLMDRKLVQWILAYLGIAWLMLQLNDVLSEIWGWPAQFQQAVSLILGLGAVPALVVAWYHGEKGRQEICRTECALVAASIMASVVVVWSFGLGAGR